MTFHLFEFELEYSEKEKKNQWLLEIKSIKIIEK